MSSADSTLKTDSNILWRIRTWLSFLSFQETNPRNRLIPWIFDLFCLVLVLVLSDTLCPCWPLHFCSQWPIAVLLLRISSLPIPGPAIRGICEASKSQPKTSNKLLVIVGSPSCLIRFIHILCKTCCLNRELTWWCCKNTELEELTSCGANLARWKNSYSW